MLLWDYLLWGVSTGSNSVASTNDLYSPNSFDSSFYISSILSNTNVAGGLAGLAVASPSKSAPNYYFHWVRDGAITIDGLVNAYNTTNDPLIAETIDGYLTSSSRLQAKHTRSGLGEPKFYVDGTPFDDSWGRPQNDGPALRSMVSAKWAAQRGTLAEHWGLLKSDLEYTARNWALPCYDLWEELYGYHFFTSITQYGAMKVGAHIARRLDHHNDAGRYAQISDQIAEFIESNFMPGHSNEFKHIAEHFPSNLGGRQGLDTASVIAVLELDSLAGWIGSPLAFEIDHPAIKASVNALIDDFKDRYPINYGNVGGIGRYPEDVYDGIGMQGGNPWFICTASIAEALVIYGDSRADELFAFIKAHRGDTLSEQIDAITGYMRGAESLTWSYSSTLRALSRRLAGGTPSTHQTDLHGVSLLDGESINY